MGKVREPARVVSSGEKRRATEGIRRSEEGCYGTVCCGELGRPRVCVSVCVCDSRPSCDAACCVVWERESSSLSFVSLDVVSRV